jgi:hypothetical protein
MRLTIALTELSLNVNCDRVSFGSKPIDLNHEISSPCFIQLEAFSRDHPHLVTAKGHIEMISENTFLVHLEPDREARHQGGRSLEADLDDDESVMMKLFFELDDELIAEADLEDNINEIDLFTTLPEDSV